MPKPMQNVPVSGMKKRFPRVFGRYILEKSLSRGGMGEVMLAVARHVNERCVIKTIRTDLTGDEEFIGRFADEAKIMVRIEHPNIIRVFDAGKVEHDYYIAMQYVHGRDLGDVLDRAYERGEPMPHGLGLYITDQLLRGLDYVHNLKDEHGRHMGLVHRDISPQNVLIGFDGSVKLIDFGLARTDILPARTQGALAVGKYGYMSPEQARHESIDGRADIYSAGVMLFEVFTGDRLVDEQDQATLWQRVLNPKHRSPKTVVPALPELVERLIMRAVEVSPDSRFQSARQMREFASQLKPRDCNRDGLVRYLQYLYPKVDFSPPGVPKFDELMGGTEQSIIIATSDKGALSVFGRGDLPIEWTMQLDSKLIRDAVEESRRKQGSWKNKPSSDTTADAQRPSLVAQNIGSEPTLLRSPKALNVPADKTTSDAREHLDDRTQVSHPPSSSTDRTQFVRASDTAKTPVDALASVPRNESPYRDDEMTIMMNAPPSARAIYEGEMPTRLSASPDDTPRPVVQAESIAPSSAMHITSQSARRVRAIKEKNSAQERGPRADRNIEPRPWRKKAIEVHRRTVPVEPTAGSDPRPAREAYATATEPSLSRQPSPWMMWGVTLLGLAFLILAIVLFAVAL